MAWTAALGSCSTPPTTRRTAWITSEAQINANTGNTGTAATARACRATTAARALALTMLGRSGLASKFTALDGSLFNVGTNQTFITDSFGAPDIGGTAWIGYVGHFGGGFLAGVAIEDANGHIQNNATVLGNTYHYSNFPDLTAKVGVEQGWGSAYVSGIIHNTDVSNAFWAVGGLPAVQSTDTTGWGIAGAVTFNATPAITLERERQLHLRHRQGVRAGSGRRRRSPTNNAATSFGVGVYGNGGLFLAQDAIATPTGYGIAEVLGRHRRRQASPSIRQMFVALGASYGELNYSEDPVIVAKSITAWSIGGDANWKPIANLNVRPRHHVYLGDVVDPDGRASWRELEPDLGRLPRPSADLPHVLIDFRSI